MPKIKIHNPGILTTVQDAGRFGYQQFGMPVSGAMDTYSLQLANFLLGNNLNEACLEATAIGPEIEFEGDTFIAICGADMLAKVNGRDINMNETIQVKSGDKLTFSGLKNGFRSYIGFAGGIDVPYVMESKSTYLRGRIGGYEGRALATGDILDIGECSTSFKPRVANKYQIHVYKDNLLARVVAGPEANHFTIGGLAVFLGSEFELSSQCDRMGYRLMGKRIEHSLSSDIISSGIAFGTIQVPAHGEPIIMMADRQTTGGYARIANIISADLPYLGQLQPGDKIRFEEIDLPKAIELQKQKARLLSI